MHFLFKIIVIMSCFVCMFLRLVEVINFNMLEKNGRCKVFHNGIRENTLFSFSFLKTFKGACHIFKVSFSVVTLQAFWMAYSNWVFAFWLSYRCHWADFCFLCFLVFVFFGLVFFCQLFAQRRIIRRKMKHTQTCTLSCLEYSWLDN